MTWFTYEMPPIDNYWENLRTVEDVAREFAGNEAAEIAAGGNPRLNGMLTGSEFLQDWESAEDAASTRGLSGPLRQKPVVFWVPTEDGFKYGFVIKADANGTTYVVSPVPLHHLSEWA